MDSGTWAPEYGSDVGAWQRTTLAQLKVVADGLIVQGGITSRIAFVFARWAGYSEFEARVIARHVKLAVRTAVSERATGHDVAELEDGSYLVKQKSGVWSVGKEKPQDWRDPAAGDGRFGGPSSSPFYSTTARGSTEWGNSWLTTPTQQP